MTFSIRKHELFGIKEIVEAFEDADWLQTGDLGIPGNSLWKHSKDSNAPMNELIKFIPFSSINHLLDGWSLLHSSINSMLSGSTHIAIHTAYYAELKGAMSILALHGIFNFFSDNLQCIKSGGANPLFVGKERTHKAIPILFSQVVENTDILSILISRIEADTLAGITSITIGEYIVELGVSGKRPITSLEALTKELILDANQLETDQKARNLNTYQPSNEYGAKSDPDTTLSEMLSLWNTFNQDASGLNISLNSQFLLLLLKRLYDGSGKWEIEKDVDGNETETLDAFEKRKMDQFIIDMKGIVSRKSGHALDASRMEAVLNHFKQGIFFKFLSVVDDSSEEYPFAIIARASLLLFIATILIQKLQDYTTAPWLEKFITERNIGEFVTEPATGERSTSHEVCNAFMEDRLEKLGELTDIISSSGSYRKKRMDTTKQIFICNTPEIVPAYLFSR